MASEYATVLEVLRTALNMQRLQAAQAALLKAGIVSIVTERTTRLTAAKTVRLRVDKDQLRKARIALKE